MKIFFILVFWFLVLPFGLGMLANYGDAELTRDKSADCKKLGGSVLLDARNNYKGCILK